jgi:hypothetical protein
MPWAAAPVTLLVSKVEILVSVDCDREKARNAQPAGIVSGFVSLGR